MKGTISAAEAHRQYSEGMTAFRRQIADQALRDRFAREADTFFRACALGLWQRDGASLSPRHVEFYNAIYTKGNPVPSSCPRRWPGTPASDRRSFSTGCGPVTRWRAPIWPAASLI